MLLPKLKQSPCCIFTFTSDIKYDLEKHSSFEEAEIFLHLEIFLTFWFCVQSENWELSNIHFFTITHNMELGLYDCYKTVTIKENNRCLS